MLHHKLYDELDAIVTYRNRLAHGNRFSERPGQPGNLQDVVKALKDILTEIKGWDRAPAPGICKTPC